MHRSNKKNPPVPDFGERLRQVTREYGSRYALAKATSIPASTLQSYEAGSNPGAHALLRLARIANVDLNWLLTGKGQIRPTGLIPGAALVDVLMVDQYEIGTAINMSIIVGQVPYSRHILETKSGLKDPKLGTLLTVEADADLYDIARGDLVLIDRTQTSLLRDGIYLLDLPGIALRAIIRRVGDKVTVLGPDPKEVKPSERSRIGRRRSRPGSQEVRLRDLLGSGRFNISKIVGRAVRVDRGI